MIKAAVISGADNNPQLNRLVQLLHDHPEVELVNYTDTSNAGHTLDELFPFLTGETELAVTQSPAGSKADVVFLVGDDSHNVDIDTLDDKTFVIDMTGRYIDDSRFVQGIPELNRKAMVRGARFVAMPDAITTAVALALLPLAKTLMLNANVHVNVVTNDKDADDASLTNRRLDQNVVEQLNKAVKTLHPAFSNSFKGIVFTGDTPQGLMAVTTVNTDLNIDELKKLYNEFYDDHNFAFVIDNIPDISDVRDTNKSFIHLDKADGKAVITGVLDTDIKGGAGNAVHVMNLLFGLIEKVGL